MTIQEHLPHDQVNDESLSFLKAIGVDYVSIHPSPPTWDGEDRQAYWHEMRRRAESHGLRLQNVGTKTWEEICLGTPDRDEKVSAWCTMLRNLGAAGIPTLGYTFQPGGYFRTTPTRGRGDTRYSSFDYDEMAEDPPDRSDRRIEEDRLQENLERFLEEVLPVAEAAGVVMALHPDDPPIPEPLGGVPRIVSSLQQYKRIFERTPSDNHAMLFCQGCVAEMGEDIPAAIRGIGSLGKIAYVHFRNIRGTPGRFEEVFLDEGDADMFETMAAYKAIGFEGPFMMDHTPRFSQSQAEWAGRAFAVGYMRALIRAVYR